MLGARPWPVFCLLLGVSSDYAQPITGQVTEVTCPLLRRSQTELTPIQRQKTDPGQVVTPGLYLVFNIKRWTPFRARAPGVYIPISILIVIDSPQTNLRHDFSKLLSHTLTYGSRFLSLPALAGMAIQNVWRPYFFQTIPILQTHSIVPDAYRRLGVHRYIFYISGSLCPVIGWTGPCIINPYSRLEWAKSVRLTTGVDKRPASI